MVQTNGRKSRPQRWREALDELRALQAAYESWLENLPDRFRVRLREGAGQIAGHTRCKLCRRRLSRRVPAGTMAYWITSVAWKRSVGGMVRPRAWAVLRLITSSNVMGCSTGRSAGLAPRKILWTKVAA
jgi:hypothetical protein